MNQANPPNIRVLLIEDADTDALLIERLIRKPDCGIFTVDRVDCLSAATELMLTESFDVALLDLNLPDGEGIDSLHCLRAVDSRLPIVILTGHQDEDLGLLAVETGAQDFICKSSISGTILYRVLRYAVARHRKMLGFAAEAQTDFLTGLPNRRQFDKCFSDMVATNKTMYFGMIDVDHFKQLNDSYGHAYGDYVLRQLAKIMQSELQSFAHIARLGGEEFAVLMPGMNRTTAFEAMDKLRQRIENADWQFEQRDVMVTISVGLALVDSTRPWTFAASSADEALYQAKHSGRNQVCHSDSSEDVPPTPLYKANALTDPGYAGLGVTNCQTNTNNPVIP
ncbi:diguanylate cyclase (GGDEF) domain-containing protein [Neorhodopirellula lusitana]|uniref:diguanylate cyclase n=1 Tax=Neorhodopirellula lusitana TaxID=445327 RepID=A0ABY1Q1S4_9BACT|nr:diguanylate cyclase [Neorhodopirellula lusitana]SMP56650.1 diguanylate cyclase (GGDEF) domain-containing protein [Neorhodopirellula lusitana]